MAERGASAINAREGFGRSTGNGASIRSRRTDRNAASTRPVDAPPTLNQIVTIVSRKSRGRPHITVRAIFDFDQRRSCELGPALIHENTTLTLAERAVPRYTSYPDCAAFLRSGGAAGLCGVAGRAARDATLSLYLHVPYCTELCLYCGCTTKAVRRRGARRSLCRQSAEGDRAARRRGRRPARRPSALGRRHAIDPRRRDHRRPRRTAPRTFDFTQLAEHAIELDPRRLTAELAGGSAASASPARASAPRTSRPMSSRRSAACSRSSSWKRRSRRYVRRASPTSTSI